MTSHFPQCSAPAPQRPSAAYCYTAAASLTHLLHASAQCLLQASLGRGIFPQTYNSPFNSCQIVRCRSFLAGTMNYKYITETFF